jgi:hypothetical protein
VTCGSLPGAIDGPQRGGSKFSAPEESDLIGKLRIHAGMDALQVAALTRIETAGANVAVLGLDLQPAAGSLACCRYAGLEELVPYAAPADYSMDADVPEHREIVAALQDVHARRSMGQDPTSEQLLALVVVGDEDQPVVRSDCFAQRAGGPGWS